jgi:hypothetical protein
LLANGGHCVNCAEPKASVRLRQWLLCDACARVARSFGRSIVAARELLNSAAAIRLRQHGIELVETDPPRLNRPGGTKLAAIDFEGRNVANGIRLFGIEMKTGQRGIGAGAVDPMGEFQLDCSDCNDLATVGEREGLPIYLVHAQVVERATPPTRQFVSAGYWWTDPVRMGEGCRDVRNRSREIRPAAYYAASIFSPLDGFADHILTGGAEELNALITQLGRFPALYTGQPKQSGRELTQVP